jgi:Ca2+-binding RTX toxin-like protein
LVGNTANNKLDGGIGADKMTGGLGNDNYTVDNVGDSITELSGEGTDSVLSTISYSLGNNLENLILFGNQTINGTGNALANTIKGNGVANTLAGGSGADTLVGGNGKDILVGGSDKDKLDLTETTAVTDTIKIVAGDSKVAAYDTVTAFALGDGISNGLSDQLDLDGTVIAADTAGTNGVDAGIFKSHVINNGIISFDDADTYAAALTLSAGNLNAVFSYLQSNVTSGATLAFTAVGNTYVFQDEGVNDTLVQLTGITASNVNTTGLLADGVWLV